MPQTFQHFLLAVKVQLRVPVRRKLLKLRLVDLFYSPLLAGCFFGSQVNGGEVPLPNFIVEVVKFLDGLFL